MVTPEVKSSSTNLRGIDILHDPTRNKGTAFTSEERAYLGLRGLLPSRVFSQEEQVERVMENLNRKPNGLEKYIFLMSLQDRNENLFFRVVAEHLEEMMPLIYTPTVGQACQEYGHIFRRPRGLFISIDDLGHVDEIVSNWYHDDVRVIVVTDGERILGLGDLGANGMGIPVGKLALYTACAGIHPNQCLPVTLDVGTNNESLLNDPLYIGLPQHRERGEAYDQLVDEFITAARTRYPNVLIQFEDFGNHNAFELLKRYQDKICTFNDDIQGTAAVALAGIQGALKLTQQPIESQKFLFFGAGEAGIGIADLLVMALSGVGIPAEKAREACWFVDSKGLVVSSRTDLNDNKRRYAHDLPFITDLADIVDVLKPTALIGVSGQANTFTPEVLARMGHHNPRPIIFALSNPTSKSECTAESAYTHTQGRAIFASGSPFAPVVLNGQIFVSGQANNSYIFPGVGLGIVASGARHVTNAMFYAATTALSELVTDSDLAQGRVFPSLKRIREISRHIAIAVAKMAHEQGLATTPVPDDWERYVESLMYNPL